MSAESATSGQWECDGSGSLTSVRHRDTGLGCSGGATGGIGADSCGWQKRTGRHRAATRTTGTGLSVSGPRRRQVTTGRFSWIPSPRKLLRRRRRMQRRLFRLPENPSELRQLPTSCSHIDGATTLSCSVILSFCHSVILSLSHSLTLSFCHSVILSHFSLSSPPSHTRTHTHGIHSDEGYQLQLTSLLQEVASDWLGGRAASSISIAVRLPACALPPAQPCS